MSAEDLPAIIPLPARMQAGEGHFSISSDTALEADESNRTNAETLRSLLRGAGFGLPPGQTTGGNTIRLACSPADDLGSEGYRLSVTPGRVEISSPGPAGVFHGIQSLRQLLPVEIERRTPVRMAEWKIPCLEIVDRPRFSWRGFMLDEGRHFLGKENLLRLLDLMALHKLNRLHWHLTEDQGWRIEIRHFPRLTGIGSRRAGTSAGFYGRHDGLPYGGFYTQADIREIVAHAATRHITIVPEIEMPGHSLAALAAHPELSCTGGPFQVATHFGIFPELYCAGKEATFSFLQIVLDEVMDLFPSQFIHIGGDEAPK